MEQQGAAVVTVKQIKDWAEAGELWRFYKTQEWMKEKAGVLEEDHNECQICKQKGIIKRYDIAEDGTKKLIRTVHHVNHVRSHPELALSRFYYVSGQKKRNLITVCKACHNILHPEKRKNFNSRIDPDAFVNEERW